MSKVKAAFGRAGSFFGRHKKAMILLLVVLVAAVGVWYFRFRRPAGMPAAAGAAGGDYVRTVTLQKGTLDDSISATGTVSSDDVSNVTTDLKYTVKEVNVQVGDLVQAGDVICTLDTESLEKSIQKAQENLAESKAQAEKTYQRAQQNLTELQAKTTEAWDTMAAAEDAKDDAWSAYDAARSKITSFQSEADSAASWQETKLTQLNSAMAAVTEKQAAYNTAYSAWQTALTDGSTAEQIAALEAAAQEAQAQLDAANTAQTDAQTAYDEAKAQAAQKQQALTDAQNTLGYNQLQSAYQQAQAAYEQAKTAYEQAVDQAESAEQTRDDALEAYNKAGESDELTELQEQLEQCTLTAETSGKVTAVNATVGSMIEGAAATIQNTDQLKIDITIPEYDIGSVQVGMKARITSDVIDGEVNGTLSQISPTATGGGSSSSSFAAQITVDDANSGLLIGTNAKVEIILSTTEDVFTVPLDAIGENEAGESVIYVRADASTSSPDSEPVFEEVVVTVGESNDYYAEISGDTLEEGMVVRAAANEEEATESGESGMTMEPGMMGQAQGGEMQGSMTMTAPAAGGGAGGGRGGAPGMGG